MTYQRALIVILFALPIAACDQSTPAPDSSGTDTASEDTASKESDSTSSCCAAPFVGGTGTYDIGILPDSASACPTGSDEVYIYMDDEDGGNTSHTGWDGGLDEVSGDSYFRLCRVDGADFYPLSTTNTITKHYAVLKLGSTCPNGSFDVWRYFDNEDRSNANKASTNISPNVVNSNTKLYFCLFRYGSTTMSSFPDLDPGYEYGVFASASFKYAIDTGYHHTDDENRRNANSYSAGSYTTDAQRIISGGSNTDIYTVRVR